MAQSTHDNDFEQQIAAWRDRFIRQTEDYLERRLCPEQSPQRPRRVAAESGQPSLEPPVILPLPIVQSEGDLPDAA